MEILKYGNFCSQVHITKQTQITVYNDYIHLIPIKRNATIKQRE